MVSIVAFLAFTMLITDKSGKNTDFFDKSTSSSLRGFWCIVILLVHTPEAYQNTIQDLIGSFAYIGVTFFFISSSFGVMQGIMKKGEAYFDGFWKNRLKRLLIPMFISNVFMFLFTLATTKKCELDLLIQLTGWVRQLLYFYFIVWFVYKGAFKKLSDHKKNIIICVLTLVLSLVTYFTGGKGISGWPTEMWGCLYGVFLALNKEKVKKTLSQKFFILMPVFLIAAGVAGLLYLKYKYVFFFGEYLLKVVLGLLITVVVFTYNSKFKIGNPVNRFLGNISYEIYLVHALSFLIVEYSLPEIDSGMFILLSIIITVVLSVVINKIANSVNKKRLSR